MEQTQTQQTTPEDAAEPSLSQKLRDATSELETARLLCPVFQKLGGIAFIRGLEKVGSPNPVYSHVKSMLEAQNSEQSTAND